jgi:hypothetical protein
LVAPDLWMSSWVMTKIAAATFELLLLFRGGGHLDIHQTFEADRRELHGPSGVKARGPALNEGWRLDGYLARAGVPGKTTCLERTH